MSEKIAVIGSGGRVLYATGFGSDLPEARDTAYAVADKISWPGLDRRSDIAGKE